MYKSLLEYMTDIKKGNLKQENMIIVKDHKGNRLIDCLVDEYRLDGNLGKEKVEDYKFNIRTGEHVITLLKVEVIFQIVYFDKDGNFNNTNLEFKNKELGIKAVDLKTGNWKEYNTEFIQLYESHYDEYDQRVLTELVYEIKVS